MDERLKSFLEENKKLIKENRWCELYDKASDADVDISLANFFYEGLGQETMLDLFTKEGKIPYGMFNECRKLESITIPDNVTSIGDAAFAGCSGLTSIEFAEPSSAVSVGNYAFRYCDSLTSITIPDSVTSIGWCAFGNCYKLKSITIPNSVTTIGRYAFTQCTCHIIFECDEKVVTDWALRGFEGTYEFR